MTPTPATFSTGDAPFALVNGGNIAILVGSPDYLVEPTYAPVPGGSLIITTFKTSDFGNIGAATAAEVAAALNVAAFEQAAPGSGPAYVATVEGEAVVVTASITTASNGSAGPALQPLVQSSMLAALGVMVAIYYPTGFPGIPPSDPAGP